MEIMDMQTKYAHILLADDDPDDVELFQSALAESCPAVKLTVAQNGVELMSMLRSLPKPNVIVLDLNMPMKSGKECLVDIRKMKEYDDIPVIILSTSNNKSEKNFCMINGADNYFVKPPSFEHMKKIAEVMCLQVAGE